MQPENHGYDLYISKYRFSKLPSEVRLKLKPFKQAVKNEEQKIIGYNLLYVEADSTASSEWKSARLVYLRTLYNLVYKPYGGQSNVGLPRKPLHHGSVVDVSFNPYYKPLKKWVYVEPVIEYVEPSPEEQLANKRAQDLTRVNYTPVKANLPQPKKQYRSVQCAYTQDIGL